MKKAHLLRSMLRFLALILKDWFPALTPKGLSFEDCFAALTPKGLSFEDCFAALKDCFAVRRIGNAYFCAVRLVRLWRDLAPTYTSEADVRLASDAFLISRGAAIAGVFFFVFFQSSLFSEEIQNTKTEVTEKASEMKFPFIGKVQGRNINVRSGSNVNYEVLTQLQQDDLVIVMQEAYGWYKILPPEGVYLWVHQSLVKDNQTTTDSVNVRGRPALDGSINCQLNRGDTVETISQEGDWLKIKPPRDAQVWIARDFVIFDRPHDLEKGVPVKSVQVAAAKKHSMFQEAESFEKAEFLKPVDQIQMEEMINKYQSIVDEFPEDEALRGEVVKKIEDLELRNKEFQVALKQGDSVSEPKIVSSPEPIVLEKPLTEEKSNGVAEQVRSSRAPTYDEAWRSPPNRTRSDENETGEIASPEARNDKKEGSTEPIYEIYEGNVETDGFGKNKRYKLIENRRRVCYVTSGNLKLDDYLHQRVRVYGKAVSWIYPRIPVVQAEKIEER